MARLSPDNRTRAEAIVACYPQRRSALIPLCHLAQAQDGWLSEEAMEDIAGLLGCTPAEVRGTATFYDMLHTEPVGRHVITVCTNIACMLAGAYEVLDHAEASLGISVGQTTADGEFTLEEAECLAGCDNAPCVQVNHRFFGPLDADGFDALTEDLRSGRLADTVPAHGILSRVDRSVGLPARAARSAPGAGADPKSGSATGPATGAVPE
jgi:NADH-quinone oxidoreductase subunit E